MKKHLEYVKVRYGETDQMGVVHHGNYAQYLELARLGWLESFGVSYKKMEEEGIMLPVYEMNLKYKGAAVFDEVLQIEVWLKELPTAKITFVYEIKNAQGKLLTQAETTLVFTNAKTRKPIRCPEYILKLLNTGK